jgi:hypothetical protein
VNLELTSLDPDLERTLRRARRAQVEMGDNQRNPRVEEHEEHQDAREGNGSREELMMWISRRHSGNCSHLLRSVPIRASCYHRLMQPTTILSHT